MRPAIAIGVLSAVAVLTQAPVAQAHVTFETREARIGASYKAILRVPHGCDGSATRRIEVKIPEGVIAVKPMPKPAWSITSSKGAYAKAYNFYHGAKLHEGVLSLAWEGGPLGDEYYDEFVFSAFVADSLAPGTTLFFPVLQQCERGELRWFDVPAAGQDAHALKFPAPALKLISTASAAAASPAVFKLASLTVSTPWLRATPGGAKTTAGYLTIRNDGQTSDRLIGGTLAAAGRTELHETLVTNGIAKMRPLANGLEIAPGETVELAPSNKHMMFLDLTSALGQGQKIKGTLIFEKAGTLAIEFTVGAVGAPMAGHTHH